MDLGLREGDGEAEHAALAVLADPDRREDVGVADDAVDPDLFIAGIEKEIGKLSGRVRQTSSSSSSRRRHG